MFIYSTVFCDCNYGLTLKNILPRGHDLQSEGCVPGALSNGTNEPVGHSLQLVLT